MRLIMCLFICLTGGAAFAGQTEIDHLLTHVKKSDCTFIRNGKSYSGPDAAAHIQKKYNYFKDKIHSSEDFIRLCATKSKLSGQYYTIICKKTQTEVAKWLIFELNRYRMAGSK